MLVRTLFIKLKFHKLFLFNFTIEKSWGIIKEAADELDRNPHMKIKQNRSLWRSVPREVYDTLCET